MKNLFSDIKMRVFPECYPCFIRQANIAMEMAGVSGADVVARIMRTVFEGLEQADFTKTPAHVTSDMHRRIREALGLDPFSRVKARYNELALAMYPELKARVAASPEPVLTAARLAIAGNIIDFGIYSSVDVEATVERALNSPLQVDESKDFLKELTSVEEVLYLLDNAGEVVFDRIFIEEILSQGKQVTAVVKAGPIINDCTLEDAASVGLDKLCSVIDNGADHVGTILELTSESFRNMFEYYSQKGRLIISKGQGNFETLVHENRPIWFLFQAKCQVVARLLSVKQEAMLFARGGTSALL